MSDSPGLLDFAIGLVNSVINLPDGQVKFFEEFKIQENCEINLLIKTFLVLVEMMFGLVNVRFSLPEWQRIIMASSWLSNTPFKVEEFSSLLSVIKCSRHHELHGFCIHLKLNHQLRHATIQLDCNEH